MNNPALYCDPCGYFPPSPGDAVDGARRAAGAAGGATRGGAEAIGGGVEAGAEWLGNDYHWLAVGEVGGAAAFVVGVEIVTAGTATPLVAGLGGAMIAGGLGVGASATAVDIALRTRSCREGSRMSCAEAGVTAVTAPFSFVPGKSNLAIGLIGPAVSTVSDIASNLQQEQPLARMRPPKE